MLAPKGRRRGRVRRALAAGGGVSGVSRGYRPGVGGLPGGSTDRRVRRHSKSLNPGEGRGVHSQRGGGDRQRGGVAGVSSVSGVSPGPAVRSRGWAGLLGGSTERAASRACPACRVVVLGQQ